MNRNYLHQVSLAIDQLLNTLLAGHADETLSARAYRCQFDKRRWMIVRRTLDGIFFWQDGHCFNSYLSELERKHLPSHYLQ
jgi:hypothetical protein